MIMVMVLIIITIIITVVLAFRNFTEDSYLAVCFCDEMGILTFCTSIIKPVNMCWCQWVSNWLTKILIF